MQVTVHQREMLAQAVARNPRLARRGFYMDAQRCWREGMSAEDWRDRARRDPYGPVVGEKAIVAISECIWNNIWERR